MSSVVDVMLTIVGITPSITRALLSARFSPAGSVRSNPVAETSLPAASRIDPEVSEIEFTVRSEDTSSSATA